jgi:hypothetical protein
MIKQLDKNYKTMVLRDWRKIKITTNDYDRIKNAKVFWKSSDNIILKRYNGETLYEWEIGKITEYEDVFVYIDDNVIDRAKFERDFIKNKEIKTEWSREKIKEPWMLELYKEILEYSKERFKDNSYWFKFIKEYTGSSFRVLNSCPFK